MGTRGDNVSGGLGTRGQCKWRNGDQRGHCKWRGGDQRGQCKWRGGDQGVMRDEVVISLLNIAGVGLGWKRYECTC